MPECLCHAVGCEFAVIFAFHAYPWLIHRLTYRRTNHDNIHVRGYKDTIDRVPKVGDNGGVLKEKLKEKLIEHKHYIHKNGEDLPEIHNWKWGSIDAGKLGKI